MEFNRPIVMSVAGLDPSGGAGLLADIKTFEQHKVHGLGIATAQTVQTEDAFFSLRWESSGHILYGITKMLARYKLAAVKIGIVQDFRVLYEIVSTLKTADEGIRIIVDPVIRSTTGFDFRQQGADEAFLYETLQKITLITPNYTEALQLVPGKDSRYAAEKMARYCAVLLKGGHNDLEPGVDYLFTGEGITKLEPNGAAIFPKHGSGCVLSAAIAANMARGDELVAACSNAKRFTEKYLSSNPSLLGYYVC